MNIENMGGRDQSQVKIKFKKFKKVKSVPKDVPKSHNDDKMGDSGFRRSNRIPLHVHNQEQQLHSFGPKRLPSDCAAVMWNAER